MNGQGNSADDVQITDYNGVKYSCIKMPVAAAIAIFHLSKFFH